MRRLFSWWVCFFAFWVFFLLFSDILKDIFGDPEPDKFHRAINCILVFGFVDLLFLPHFSTRCF